MDEEKKALMKQAMAELGASGIIEQAMNNGDKAPDFTLPSASGEPVNLKGLLSEGPVVINFYRGGW